MLFWKRKKQPIYQDFATPQTVDDALRALPRGYKWDMLNCIAGSEWIVYISCNDGWDYKSPYRTTLLEAMQIAVESAWKKYNHLDTVSE